MRSKNNANKANHPNDKLIPNWLKSTFELENKMTSCKKHPQGTSYLSENFFCIMCCVRMCTWCKGKFHDGHEVFQLQSVIYCLTLEGQNLKKKGISVIDIHPYKCNSQVDNYHIFSHPSTSINIFVSDLVCIICGHKLMQKGYKFCSLQCMVSNIGSVIGDEVKSHKRKQTSPNQSAIYSFNPNWM